MSRTAPVTSPVDDLTASARQSRSSRRWTVSPQGSASRLCLLNRRVTRTADETVRTVFPAPQGKASGDAGWNAIASSC